MADYRGRKGIAQVFSGINLLAGLWLILAPWLLGYNQTAPTRNDVAIGIAVVLLAGIRLLLPDRYREISWTNMALGVWLVCAPFVLQYGPGPVLRTVAFWNDLVFGLIIFICAWLSAETTRRIRSLGS